MSENRPYNFVAVDGGTLNNEPIELARSVWERVSEEDKKQIDSVEDLDVVHRAVRLKTLDCPYAIVMVDPFPDLADFGKDPTENDTGLLKILGPMIGALRSQSLFKIEELLRAVDKGKGDRFLIAPIRYTALDKLARNSIACGFLEALGVFYRKRFANTIINWAGGIVSGFCKSISGLKRRKRLQTAGIWPRAMFSPRMGRRFILLFQ